MTIATMEDLAAVPIGSSIFYNEDTYKRHSEGWWSTADKPDEAVIRDRHLIGAVEAGRVSLEDNRLMKAGTLCSDGTYWYLLQQDASGATVNCLVIRKDNGSVAYENHPMSTRTMRPLRLDPQPETNGLITLLIARIAEKDNVIEEYHEKVAEVQTGFNDLHAQLAGAATFRRALRTFLDGADVVPTSWEGVNVGDFISTGNGVYRTLPIGTLVKHEAGTHWWKRTETEWRCRENDGSSTTMARNQLVTVGNGIAVDPGGTI